MPTLDDLRHELESLYHEAGLMIEDGIVTTGDVGAFHELCRKMNRPRWESGGTKPRKPAGVVNGELP